MHEPNIGIKVKDLSGVEVTVLLRMAGTGYYASMSEEHVSEGSSISGFLGRGATMNEAIQDLLKAREKYRKLNGSLPEA